ncbi:MAG: metallophosphoesterase [Sphingobacteriaceae bacterium]|nr:MAG: metallophosphoesterase [Sphingobacteriaceae bacterium]
MNKFVFVALVILSLLFVFLGFRLTGIGSYSWLISGIIVGLLLLYPLVWYDVLAPIPRQITRAVLHFNIGLLSLIIPFIIIRDVLFVPLSLIEPKLFKPVFSINTTLLMFGIFLIFLFFGYRKAAKGPILKSVEVPINGLPAALVNYTILQISDLHAGAGINRVYVENVVQKAIVQKVDIIVLTGDIADGSFEKYKDRVEPLSSIVGNIPVLYIVGNHEYLKDSDRWLNYFKDMGIRVLLNEYTKILKNGSTVLFAGITDPGAEQVHPGEGPDIKKSIWGSPETDIKILLAHRPDVAEKASEHFDLQLSGHTHAGQFFPWNLIIKIFQPFSSGLKKYGRMWVYTNQGTGFWGPPIRLGTTSEMTILKLVRE